MYKILKTDGRAKRAEFTTVHGTVQTPVFMNVGTVAAIKGAVATTDLQQIGTQIELSNTYHLHVRPGDSVRDIYDWTSGTWHDFRKLLWIHCVCADGIWYGNDDICGTFDRHYSGADRLYSRIRTACGDQYIGRKCTRREGYPEIKSNGAGIDPDHIIDYGSKWYRTLPIRISIYASVYELSQCSADRK